MKNYHAIALLGLFAALSFKKMDMAKITPNLYMDKYEVTNADWKYFEKHLISEGEDPAEYRTNDVWEWQPFIEYYYKHLSYESYPVVGVTYEGAKKYCAWKGSYSEIEGTFRLPTFAEIQYQIQEGEQGRKWEKWEKRAKKGKTSMYNFATPQSQHVTAPSSAYIYNKFGVHNIKGNVSEMTDIEGQAAGGSWTNMEDDKDWATELQTYNAPNNWLGFRCVCEL